MPETTTDCFRPEPDFADRVVVGPCTWTPPDDNGDWRVIAAVARRFVGSFVSANAECDPAELRRHLALGLSQMEGGGEVVVLNQTPVQATVTRTLPLTPEGREERKRSNMALWDAFMDKVRRDPRAAALLLSTARPDLLEQIFDGIVTTDLGVVEADEEEFGGDLFPEAAEPVTIAWQPGKAATDAAVLERELRLFARAVSWFENAREEYDTRCGLLGRSPSTSRRAAAERCHRRVNRAIQSLKGRISRCRTRVNALAVGGAPWGAEVRQGIGAAFDDLSDAAHQTLKLPAHTGAGPTHREIAGAIKKHAEAIRLVGRFLQDIGGVGVQGRALSAAAAAEPAASTTPPPPAEDKRPGSMSPSREKARRLHEFAISAIEGVENMTYAEEYEALIDDARVGGEGLPPSAASYAKYLREAGVRKNRSAADKSPGSSVIRAEQR